MRAIVPMLLLVGCGRGLPEDRPTVTAPAEQPQEMKAWRQPALPITSRALDVIGDVMGDTVVVESTVTYGLAEGYPTELELSPSRVVFPRGCGFGGNATATWSSLRVISGDAAGLSVSAGKVRVSLVKEGVVVAELGGSMDWLNPAEGSGACQGVSSLELRHRVTIRVMAVTGFRLKSFGPLGSCGPRPVIPAQVPLLLPRVQGLASNGEAFFPANADPAATLIVTGAVLPTNDSSPSFGPGPVTISVDSTLPVDGLRTFEVVDHTQVTDVQGKLVLYAMAAKGVVPLPIVEGADLRLFTEEGNFVALQVESTTTTLGRLCAPPPAEWFLTDSSTPSVCTTPARGSPYTGIPLVSLNRQGECRFETRVPGGPLRWSSAFSATVR